MSEDEVSVKMMRTVLRILTSRALEIQTKDIYAIGMMHYYERGTDTKLPVQPLVEAMIAEQESAYEVVEEIHMAAALLPDDGLQGEVVEINHRCIVAKSEITDALTDLREANRAAQVQ